MKLSIVTVSFNQAIYLPALFASIQGQMEPEDEHIVVDPGSLDGSRNIINGYAKSDGRIKILFEPDDGPACGLNKGFGIATGEICSYLNADDFALPGSFRYAKTFFNRHPNCEILIGAVKIADAKGKLKLRGRVADWPTKIRLMGGVFQYFQQGTFFRRASFEGIGGFNVENRTCWDRELIVDMILAGSPVTVTSRPLGAFRIHSASITAKGPSERYWCDQARIHSKICRQFGGRIGRGTSHWLHFEARWNPLRWLRQLRPARRNGSGLKNVL